MYLLFSMPGGLEWILILTTLILLIPLPIIALIDILRSNFIDSTNKIVWVLVVLLLPILGPILYFTIGLKQKNKEHIQ